MTNASEKQINFINKLLEEKAKTYGDLQYTYELKTGKREFLSDIMTELTGVQASWVINQLLASPKKASQAQVNRMEQAFDRGVDKYEKLIALGKQHGLKVRAMMKKQSIIQKFNEAGIAIPAELL
jgi:hypothetical protein